MANRSYGGALDLAYVTRNMRQSGSGRVAVLATRHKPFVISMYGTTVHQVHAVRVNFRSATRADLLAFFECGGSTNHPVFYDAPEQSGHRKCIKCFPVKKDS